MEQILIQNQVPPSSDNRTSEASSSKKEAASKGQGTTDAVMYAYFLLIDAMNIQNDSTEIRAKQLQDNADQQMALNDQLQQITWEELPEVIKKVYHKTKVEGDIFHPRYVQYTVVKYEHKNTAQIAMANNVQQDKMRQDIQAKIVFAQQDAQTGSNMLNAEVNSSSGTISQAMGLLDMLKKVTNKILNLG